MNKKIIDEYFKNMTKEREKTAVKIMIQTCKNDILETKNRIEDTYSEIVHLYKEHDVELKERPMLESALKRSYGSRAGGIVNRRNKLNKHLKALNESLRNYTCK